MSIISMLTNRSKVTAAAKKIARARKREGDVAEKLFQEAFQDFQKVVSSEPVIADALYHWGFALFHQAQTKSGAEAEKIYGDAGMKFAFCMTMNPEHLGGAIDWGATLMEQARLKGGSAREDLYAQAEQKFIAANAIQAGSASYNLACIYAIHGNSDACRAALEDARDHGNLPNIGAVMNDADLASVQHEPWFLDFMAVVEEQAAAAEAKPESAAAVESEVQETPVAEALAAAESHAPKPKATARKKAAAADEAQKTDKSGE